AEPHEEIEVRSVRTHRLEAYVRHRFQHSVVTHRRPPAQPAHRVASREDQRDDRSDAKQQCRRHVTYSTNCRGDIVKSAGTRRSRQALSETSGGQAVGMLEHPELMSSTNTRYDLR